MGDQHYAKVALRSGRRSRLPIAEKAAMDLEHVSTLLKKNLRPAGNESRSSGRSGCNLVKLMTKLSLTI